MAPIPISAFAFDIVRKAFRKSVIETNMPEDQWPEHAKRPLEEMAGREPH
ncbi:hypothetical protein [Mesorhizobium sp. WSM3224]|nr:hypothetical protein [Mesorhizobium sp. WSM3224]